MKKQIILFCFLTIPVIHLAQSFITPGDTIGPFDTITFDPDYEHILIDTSAQNLWQVGPPQKTFFNSAYSAPNVIVTDTLIFYPQGNHSHFDLFLSDHNYPGWFGFDMFLDFMHKFDTDTLKDGCYITISYDDGETWTNIIEDSCLYFGECPPWTSTNIYNESDTIFNGEFGFSGNSGGWVKTGLAWFSYPVSDFYPDTMILRFNFISDSIDSGKEGWMIDQIKLYAIDLGGGQEDINYDDLVQISPNPFSHSAEVSLDKVYKRIDCVIYDLNGRVLRKFHNNHIDKIIIEGGELIDGVYILNIRLDNRIIVNRKLIVHH